MKQLVLLFTFLLSSFCSISQDVNILDFLKQQPLVQDIDTLACHDFFEEAYKILVKQPVNHSDTTQGYFSQRVLLFHHSTDAPMVLNTEGYAAHYATSPNYINELCPHLNANLITVEHRYFGQSVPENIDWSQLTVANAAADHHIITQLLKPFYKSAWLSTGISKGGQTAMYHKAFYPDDVDATIAYVAPLNFGVEDGRHEPFIANKAGSKTGRKKVNNFQLTLLKCREKLSPLFQQYIDENELTFQLPVEEIYDYCVLEYSFAFWQWGYALNSIPPPDTSVHALFDHFMEVSSPNYLSKEGSAGIYPFFVQAAHELGYYGYDIKPFRKHLKIKTTKNYLERIFLVPNSTILYNGETMKRVKSFIDSTTHNMMFIYGENDPWSATAVNIKPKPNLVKVVKNGGSHRTRINNLPELQQKRVVEIISSWIDKPLKAK